MIARRQEEACLHQEGKLEFLWVTFRLRASESQPGGYGSDLPVGMVQTSLLLPPSSGLLPLYNTEVKSNALSNEGLFPFCGHLLAVFGLRCCPLLYQGCRPPPSFCSDRTYCLVVTEHGSPSIMLHTDRNSKKGQGLKAILVEPAPLLCSPGSSILCK